MKFDELALELPAETVVGQDGVHRYMISTAYVLWRAFYELEWYRGFIRLYII